MDGWPRPNDHRVTVAERTVGCIRPVPVLLLPAIKLLFLCVCVCTRTQACLHMERERRESRGAREKRRGREGRGEEGKAEEERGEGDTQPPWSRSLSPPASIITKASRLVFPFPPFPTYSLFSTPQQPE